MRTIILAAAIAVATVSAVPAAGADEVSRLTNFTFSKAVQLPGILLQPGKYRLELADPQESRRVIKVSNEDGTKQLAMLQTVPITLRDAARDPLVLFGESPASEPDAVKAWVYPGERTGYEFIYPHDQAESLAKKYRTSVLTKSGDKVERVRDAGASAPGESR